MSTGQREPDPLLAAKSNEFDIQRFTIPSTSLQTTARRPITTIHPFIVVAKDICWCIDSDSDSDSASILEKRLISHLQPVETRRQFYLSLITTPLHPWCTN